MQRRFFRILILALVTGIVAANAPIRASCEMDSAAEAVEALALPRDPTERMARILDILRTGSESERRAIGQDAYGMIPDHIYADDLERFHDPLRQILRDEQDDWIASRVLNALHSWVRDLQPIFRDASAHASPNRRYQAVSALWHIEEPDDLAHLDSLWPSIDRWWIQAELMENLARFGSEMWIEDFIRLTRSQNIVLADAAIHALSALGGPRGWGAILGLAKDRDGPMRADAVSALRGWPDSVEALRVVLDASRAADPGVRDAGIWALRHFGQEPAKLRLKELVMSGTAPEDRVLALLALMEGGTRPWGSAAPELPDDVVRSILVESETDENAVLKVLADGPRRNRDGMGELSLWMGDDDVRVKSCPNGPSEACEAPFTWTPDPGSPSGRIVSSSGDSVRCWAGPRIEGDAHSCARIPVGEEVHVREHFELGRELWVSVSAKSERFAKCWVSEGSIERERETREEGGPMAEDLNSLEIDIPVKAVESDLGLALSESGLLEVFDRGERVVGVVLTIRESDRDQVRSLLSGIDLETQDAVLVATIRKLLAASASD